MARKTCRSTGLRVLTSLEARLEAGAIRSRAKAAGQDDPRRNATCQECATCRGYHVVVPAVRGDRPKACPLGRRPYSRKVAERVVERLRKAADPRNSADPRHQATYEQCSRCGSHHVTPEGDA